MRCASFLFPLFAVLSGPVRAEEFRTFTTADGGSKLTAAFVKLEKDAKGAPLVVLKRPADNKLTRIALEKLAEDDKHFVLASEGARNAPAFMRPRFLPAARHAALKSAGCEDHAPVELAVDRALAWLSTKQQQDGSWSSAGTTGLVLLAFAGRGYGPASAPCGPNIKRGMEFLISTAAKNKGIGKGRLSTGPESIHAPYDHAIATQALAEMYALSRPGIGVPPGLAETLVTAEQTILSHQQPDGKWGCDDIYGYSAREVRDFTISVWQVHALCACRDAGLNTPDRAKALRLAMQFFIHSQDRDGTSGKPSDDSFNRWKMTGGVLTGLQVINREKGMLRKGISWLSDCHNGGTLDWGNDCDTVVWYFDCLALSRSGGDYRKHYKSYVQALLPHQYGPTDSQEAAGSWKSESGSDSLRLSELVDRGRNTDITRTVFATLILETPYRCQGTETK